MPTTSVDMPAGLMKEIDEEVEEERYQSRSEFIRDAVRRLLEISDRIEERKLSEEARKGIDKARESGRTVSHEEATSSSS